MSKYFGFYCRKRKNILENISSLLLKQDTNFNSGEPNFTPCNRRRLVNFTRWVLTYIFSHYKIEILIIKDLSFMKSDTVPDMNKISQLWTAFVI